MEICDLCGKKEEYDNCVWYFDEQFNLCKKHHREWLKEHKPYIKLHRKEKPMTKAHSKMCEEEENLFKEWFKEKQEILRQDKKKTKRGKK